MGECEPRNFLQPCLLLLLKERPDHGYDLVERLRSLYDGESDGGGVYRALRSLERQGLVRSTWQTSRVGPARRTYHITPSGVASLASRAEALESTHRELHVFLERYACTAALTERPVVPGRNGNGRATHERSRENGVHPTRGPG